MRRPFLVFVVLWQFLLAVIASPAFAQPPPLSAARAVADASTGVEPITSIGTTLGVSTLCGPAAPICLGVAGTGFIGLVVYKNWGEVKAAAAQVTKLGGVIADAWNSLFGGRHQPSQAERQEAARRARAEAEERTRQEAIASAKEARAREQTRQLAEAYHRADAEAQAARQHYAQQVERSIPALHADATQLASQRAQVRIELATGQQAHNNATRRTVASVSAGIEKARAQAREGFDPNGPPPPEAPPKACDAPDPDTFGRRSERGFQTLPGQPGYKQLTDTNRYVTAAAAGLTPETPYVAEKASHLAMASLAIDRADNEYASGELGLGNDIVEYVNSLTDGVYSYETFRNRVSESSTFVAGMIHGATGLPGQPLEGYERAWAVGQVVGIGLMVAKDTAWLLGAMATDLGSGGLAVASAGALAPLSAAMVGYANIQAVVAATSLAVNGPRLIHALNEMLGKYGSGNSTDLPSGVLQRPRHVPVEGHNGSWSGGERGKSEWSSTKPEVLEVTKGEPVPYEDGHPRFDKWMKDSIEIEGMNGSQRDMRMADDAYAKKMGFKAGSEVKMWRDEEGLTWHHHEDGKTMQLIPRGVHRISHKGGASMLRSPGGQCNGK